MSNIQEQSCEPCAAFQKLAAMALSDRGSFLLVSRNLWCSSSRVSSAIYLDPSKEHDLKGRCFWSPNFFVKCQKFIFLWETTNNVHWTKAVLNLLGVQTGRMIMGTFKPPGRTQQLHCCLSSPFPVIKDTYNIGLWKDCRCLTKCTQTMLGWIMAPERCSHPNLWNLWLCPLPMVMGTL